ncbi:MAG: stress response translation initiation inhibitor YciH, partial [Candidatus Aenigmarchaeota archaeon]|nr:stress response translation initiation inhibitor YciH [Candidatus Aenigmarchaeota archaeon]
SEIDIPELTKKLKSKFACGGTSKNNIIELQGRHEKEVKDFLIQIGFSESQIE